MIISRANFKRFLENVQEWMVAISNFVDTDEVKASIWETKDNFSDDIDDDEEAMRLAVAQRKHNIFKNVRLEKNC